MPNTYKGPGRWTLEEDEFSGGLRITISPPQRLLAILFVPVWLCGWVLGEYAFLTGLYSRWSEVAPTDRPFLYLWGISWTIAGTFLFYVLAWNFFGREIVRIEGPTLTLGRQIFGYESSRKYDFTDVHNLHYGPLETRLYGQSPRYPWQCLGVCDGSLAFTYRGTTLRFGNGLSERHTTTLIAAIKGKTTSQAGPPEINP